MSRHGPKYFAPALGKGSVSTQPRVKGRHKPPQSREQAVLAEACAAAKRKRKGEKRKSVWGEELPPKEIRDEPR